MRRVTNEGASGPVPHGAGSVPPPLHVAAALAGLEGLFLLGVAVAVLAATERERLVTGLPTVAFFLIYGSALMWSAWQLRRRESWARSFVVLAQLIQLGLAWNFRGEQTLAVAVGIALVALIVLAGIFHPQSVRALDPG
jgi:hypothetical protein